MLLKLAVIFSKWNSKVAWWLKVDMFACFIVRPCFESITSVYRRLCKLMWIIKFIMQYHGIQLQSGCCRRPVLQTFNVVTITDNVADVQCCNQTFNLAIVSVPHTKRSLLPRLNSHIITAKTEQPRTQSLWLCIQQWYIPNRATIVLLTQQNFTELFFLVKFKTMSLMVELDIAAKLCAKALSSNWQKLLLKSLVVKSY